MWVQALLAGAAIVVGLFAYYKYSLEKRKKRAKALSRSGADMLSLTLAELARHDGTDPSLPIYVAIKGVIYDVSTKRESYGPGCGYHVFAGKDPSKALGSSSMKIEDCVPDYSQLTPKQMETLEGWVQFFANRYPVVGNVVL